MNNLWILAAAEGEDVVSTEGAPLPATDNDAVGESVTAADGSVPAEDAPPPTFVEQYGMWIWMGALFLIMYMFMIRGPKKKQEQHSQMVRSLKKNDRVCTIGGIFGTVIEVRDKEIVLKIDESNNTKMKVSPSAIRNVATEEREN